jgi:hypothetical protein
VSVGRFVPFGMGLKRVLLSLLPEVVTGCRAVIPLVL